MRHDPINHPAHYTAHPSGIEAIDLTEHMSFCLGNALKYLMRAPYKGRYAEDLRKAAWYLRREADRLQGMGETPARGWYFLQQMGKVCAHSDATLAHLMGDLVLAARAETPHESAGWLRAAAHGAEKAADALDPTQRHGDAA